MAFHHAFLSLPGEVRDNIYLHYFQVGGGYAYDAKCDKLKTWDNQPIELSLLYTCRTIAQEARHLPLSLNTIEFKTLYQPKLNNLAGCFNLVTSTYQHLQSELVMLLESVGALNLEIHNQLALDFPDFRSRLNFTVRPYQRAHERHLEDPSHIGEGVMTDSELLERDIDPSVNALRQLRSTLGWQTQDALAINASIYSSIGFYRGFSRIRRPWFSDHLWWPNSFWEAEKTLSSALNLLATHKPADFTRQIYTNFPQWVPSYPASEFLSLRFEHWAIPSPAEVKHAMDLLAIGDCWDLPGMWHEARACCIGDNGDEIGFGQRPHHHPPVVSGVRCREKIRFSAVANAIQFLETRLSHKQRLEIRNLVLHEDLPSVNQPSAHAQGLAKFYHENPNLIVERRVNLIGCVLPALASPTYVAERCRDPEACLDEVPISPRWMRSRITQWLQDALAVTDVGIPSGSFTLVLQAGSYKDYFADQFQNQIQTEIAWQRAFKRLNPEYPFDSPRGTNYNVIQNLMIQEKEIEALQTLGNMTSPILRSDFNTGVALEFDTIVNQTSHLRDFGWMREWYAATLMSIEQPIHKLDYNTRLLENFEIQMG
ncbi:hypothetical protein ACHAPO_009677 [Fusarium lateritium]